MQNWFGPHYVGNSSSSNDSEVSTHGHKYEFMSQGPLFLTATHSAFLIQGAGIEHSPIGVEVWSKEKHVSFICIRLAYYLNKIDSFIHQARKSVKKSIKLNSLDGNRMCSFMIWSKHKENNSEEIDPSFCTEEAYHKSYFYKAMVKWLEDLDPEDVPFHIEVRGTPNK